VSEVRAAIPLSGCDLCRKPYRENDTSIDVWAQEIKHYSDVDFRSMELDIPGEYMSYCVPCWHKKVRRLYDNFVKSVL
jgi:hypothetical protein